MQPTLIALLAVCLVLSSYNYLVFHVVAEMFSVVIGVMMCVIAWQTYGFTRNGFLIYLANGYFWVAVLDTAHTMLYKGMSILPVTGANHATQFWIVARYLEAFILVSAPLMVDRAVSRGLTFLAFGFISCAAGVAIFLGLFFDAYIEGTGLTPFKIYSEYVIIAILVAAVAHLWGRRRKFDREVLLAIAVAIGLTIAAEGAFTQYVSVYGTANLIGHLFKLISFYILLSTVVRKTLRAPYVDLNNEIVVRKAAEARAEEQRQRLDEIIWGTDVGTWEWNVRTGEVAFNERWANIVGYTLDELQPLSIETWTSLAHPDDLKRSDERLAKVFSGETDHYECEVRVHHKDDRWVWVLDRGKVVEWTDNGKPLRMSGTHMDITDRKEAERTVARFFDQPINLHVIAGLDGTIRRINRGAAGILGYTPAELEGR